MYRTTFVLLLLSSTLPMGAEEVAKVTVHQAEWGDTRGEAPPPPGPAVPARAAEPTVEFQSSTFRYGQGLQYFNRSSRYANAFRYRPATRTQRTWNKVNGAQYRQNRSYEGTGNTMRRRYNPNIKYGSGVPRRGRSARYGFGR